MFRLDSSTLQVFATITAGLGVVLLRHVLATRGARNVLRKDLEILAKMPDGAGRENLLRYVNLQATRLAARGTDERRDPSGMALGFTLFVMGAWLFSLAWHGSWLWYLPAAPLLLFGVFGTAESTTKRRRDERGRAIRDSSPGEKSGLTDDDADVGRSIAR